MAWILAATLAVLLATASLAWRLRRQRELLRAENERWRVLARERAARVAVVSHEVRTPVSLIGGACELLLDGAAGPLTRRQESLLDTIRVKSDEVGELARTLLTDAKIDAQIFRLNLSMVDPRRLATEVVRDLRRLYPNRITLSARGAIPRLPGDRDLLRQALINLIPNAARHAGEGVRIAVTVRPSDDGVLVTVSDDGTGMSAAERRELFTKELAGTTDTGTGLGMLITRRIVELHGGRCLIDTMADRGTAVVCALPRTAEARPQLTEEGR